MATILIGSILFALLLVLLGVLQVVWVVSVTEQRKNDEEET